MITRDPRCTDMVFKEIKKKEKRKREKKLSNSNGRLFYYRTRPDSIIIS